MGRMRRHFAVVKNTVASSLTGVRDKIERMTTKSVRPVAHDALFRWRIKLRQDWRCHCCDLWERYHTKGDCNMNCANIASSYRRVYSLTQTGSFISACNSAIEMSPRVRLGLLSWQHNGTIMIDDAGVKDIWKNRKMFSLACVWATTSVLEHHDSHFEEHGRNK